VTAPEAPAKLPAPPPSAALAAALTGLRPVPTRRPWRAFALVTAASLAAAAALLGALGVRRDLAAVPAAPLALYAVACLAVFATSLRLALVPPRGQVLPGATRLSLLLMLVMVPLSLYAGVAVGTAWIEPRRWWPQTLRCASTGLAIAGIPLSLTFIALRWLLAYDTWRSAATVAAAGGLLAALVLELHCSVAELRHVGFGHGLALIAPLIVVGVVARSVRR
jgi:hypothetical protein